MAQTNGSIESPADFRAFLRLELMRRLKANPHYSLRAFARMLSYDVSSVSKIISGKRKSGPKLIQKLGKRMGLDEELINYFIVRELGGSAPESSKGTSDFVALPIDVFSTISDWYHYAILELMYVPKFRQSPRWIAKALGLSVEEVEVAIHRLKRVGLLEVIEGKWKEAKGDKLTNLGTEAKSFAARELQKSLLQKALQALEEIPTSRRENSSITMAIDTKKLVQAKERLKLFRREMSHFLSRGSTPDDVYALTLGLFPLTNLKKDER